MTKQTIEINLATGIDNKVKDRFVGADSLLVSRNGEINKTGEIVRRSAFDKTSSSGVKRLSPVPYGLNSLTELVSDAPAAAVDKDAYSRLFGSSTSNLSILCGADGHVCYSYGLDIYIARVSDGTVVYTVPFNFYDNKDIAGAFASKKNIVIWGLTDSFGGYLKVWVFNTSTGSVGDHNGPTTALKGSPPCTYIFDSSNTTDNSTPTIQLTNSTGDGYEDSCVLCAVDDEHFVLYRTKATTPSTSACYSFRYDDLSTVIDSVSVTHGGNYEGGRLVACSRIVAAANAKTATYDRFFTVVFGDNAPAGTMYIDSFSLNSSGVFEDTTPSYTASVSLSSNEVIKAILYDDNDLFCVIRETDSSRSTTVMDPATSVSCYTYTTALTSPTLRWTISNAYVMVEPAPLCDPPIWVLGWHGDVDATTSTSVYVMRGINYIEHRVRIGDLDYRRFRREAIFYPPNASVNNCVTGQAFSMLDLGDSVWGFLAENLYKLDYDPVPFTPVNVRGTLVQPCSSTKVLIRDEEHTLSMDAVVSPTFTAVAGSGLEEGSYNYKVVYQKTRSDGTVWRSADYGPYSVTTTSSNKQVNITYQLSASGGIQAIGVEDVTSVLIYRTAVNGSVYYLQGTYTSGSSTSDTTSDATIAARSTIYTNGGVLPAGPAAASIAVAQRIDRLFLLDATEPYLYFSKPMEDRIYPEFNTFLRKYIPDGGDNTGLGVLDQYVIVFKKDRIFALSGAGPNALGVGDFGTPREVASDVGCVNPRSVAKTSLGLFFQSKRGIELLDRGLGMKWVGSAVEDYGNINIVSATVLPIKNQVRFDSEEGTTLIYDYYHGVWHVHTHNAMRQMIVDANDRLVYLSKGGHVYVDTGDSVGDDDGRLVVETAWMKMETSQGYQRISWAHLLGDISQHCRLTISVYYDYSDSAAQTFSVDASQLTQENGTVRQFRFQPYQQKCSAVKFRIEETENSKGSLALNRLTLMLEPVADRISKLPSGSTL